MTKLPPLHDGFFDGLWLAGDNCVRLFVRTEAGQRSTIVLTNVVAMNLFDVKVGNIIFDMTITAPDELTAEDVAAAYGMKSDAETLPQLLQNAQQKRLSLLTLSASYGAQGLMLSGTAEVISGHVLSHNSD